MGADDEGSDLRYRGAETSGFSELRRRDLFYVKVIEIEI